jgi:benzylsuccinate CoA-transferase BbsF subunit
MKPSPLENICVLDFSWVLAGPFATRLLADFGAEVIKVQPPLLADDSAFSRAYYREWNRNKLGISLDLSRPAGIALAHRLVSISDVVVENFTPRVMANWGLEYADLCRIRPDIILVSLSALGHDGPWKDFTGFGPTVQAFSGLTALTAFPGGEPLGAGYSVADHIAGLYASLALIAALEYRRSTGRGQFIDLSQTEALVSLLGEAFGEGGQSVRAAPEGVYPCRGSDRWCALSVESEEQWRCFKSALGWPGWAEASRFASPAGRVREKAELDRLIAGWTLGRTAEEAMALLQNAGVPAGVVQSAADLARDPQLLARRFFLKSSDGSGANQAQPFKLAGMPARKRAAPGRGRDNEHVFSKLLGLDRETLKKLRADRIIT